MKIYIITLFLTFYILSAYSTDIEAPAPGASVGQGRQRQANAFAPTCSGNCPGAGSLSGFEMKAIAKRLIVGYNKKIPKGAAGFMKHSSYRRVPRGFRRKSATAWRLGPKSFRNRIPYNTRRGYRSNQIRRLRGRTASRYATGGFRGTSATAGRRARKYYRNIRRRYNNSIRNFSNQRRNYIRKKLSNRRRRNMRRNSNRNSRNFERVVKKKVFTLIKVAKEYKEILSEISSDKKLLKKKLEDIIDRYMDF